MYPIPTKFESDYVTIIPSVKTLLKSNVDQKVWPLNNMCFGDGKRFQCDSDLLLNYKGKCETKLLLYGNTSDCEFTKLKIRKNHLEVLPNTNKFLAVFTNREEIKISCPDREETQVLQGIFLIQPDNCDLVYQNYKVPQLEVMFGTPVLISASEPKLDKVKLSNFTIQLKRLKLEDVPVSAQVPIIPETILPLKPSAWTLVLYILILVSVMTLGFRHFKPKIVHVLSRGTDPSPPVCRI